MEDTQTVARRGISVCGSDPTANRSIGEEGQREALDMRQSVDSYAVNLEDKSFDWIHRMR